MISDWSVDTLRPCLRQCSKCQNSLGNGDSAHLLPSNAVRLPKFFLQRADETMATTAPTLENWRENKITGKKITQSESTKQPINITGDISHVPWKEAKVLIFRQRREDLQELIPDNLEFLLGSASSVLGFTQLLP